VFDFIDEKPASLFTVRTKWVMRTNDKRIQNIGEYGKKYPARRDITHVCWFPPTKSKDYK